MRECQQSFHLSNQINYIKNFTLFTLIFTYSHLNNMFLTLAVCLVPTEVNYRGMLATHILTHTFQHTLYDWLHGSTKSCGSHVNFNQSKRVC